MQIEKRDASKSICTLSFAFKEAIRKEKYVSRLLNLANFEKEISFLIFNKRYKIRGIRCRSKKKKANSIVYLFWKVGLIFRNFKKIVLSSREFCKKKIILIKTGMIQTLKGKFPTRVANSSQPLATRSTLIKVFDAELKAKPCNKVGN